MAGCATCGGGGGARSAQRSSTSPTSMPQGFAPENAVLFGEPNETLLRVRVARAIGPLKIGQQAWVTGTGVQVLLDDQTFTDITSTAQRSRMWRVGAFTYTDYTEAQRVAAATGQTVIEVA